MEKINSYIPTPFTLQCFCNSCFNLPDEEKPHIYKLYSVITHVGATMSVGHYVAYTCALDIQNEYRTCTNDRTKIASLLQNSNGNAASDTASSQSGSNPSLASSNTTTTNGDKNSGPKSIKRFFFGNKKANSSNDLKSNSFKSNVNGLVNKVVANGMEKLNLGINNTTGRVLGSSNGSSISSMCQGQKCCGIKESKLVSNNNGTFISYVNGGTPHMNGGGMNGSHPEMDTLAPPLAASSSSVVVTATKPSSSDLSIASSTNSSAGGGNVIDDDATVTSTTTAITTGKAAVNTQVSNITQDHWYMCDDDKIKVMQQQQFEEHLSPTRKNMITPYLLFYARFLFYAAFVDALKETENEVASIRQELTRKSAELEKQQEEVRHLVRVNEQRRQALIGMQAKLCGLENRSKDLLCQQGTAVSDASCALGDLSARLDNLVESLLKSYEISEQELGEFGGELVNESSPSVSPTQQRNQSFLTAVVNAIKSAATSARQSVQSKRESNGVDGELLCHSFEPEIKPFSFTDSFY